MDSVQRKYSRTTINFDGYMAGASTKDVIHERRSWDIYGVQINFVCDMSLKLKKDKFLANTTNKQNFINLLSTKLHDSGFRILDAEGDADLLFLQTAVDCAAECSTTVVGEDTDLLVL